MVEISDLSKSFQVRQSRVDALRSVSQSLTEGEFFVLLGPSGSGKTTLLRCVAGLETPDDGEIRIGGETVFSAKDKISVSPEERQIGMVFQSYAIWPHMTVFENVALPLTHGRKRIARPLVRERVLEALRLVQMADVADRPAPLLSGGQQQRVALARALAVSPKLVLMDEPLSNLDARLREEMRQQIRELAKRLKMTVLYVTHDQVEAMVLADRIAVMADGAIISEGSPEQLYEKPSNKRVAEFFGSITWLDGEALDPHWIQTGLGKIAIAERLTPRQAGVAGIRPEDVEVYAVLTGCENEFEGEVVSRTFLGDQLIYAIQVNGILLQLKTMSKKPLEGRMAVKFPREKIKFYPAS